MPSRQDQLHSYQYSQQRVVAALVTHDPDPHRSPLRRAGSAALISLVVASLAVGGAAVYGLLKGRSTVEPRNEAVVFLEKGSGARYVYLKSDDRMHPVLNYSSGLLIANTNEPKLVDASSESLAKVPLGDPLGIPDAPDSLPAAKGGLLDPVWTVCSLPPEGATAPRSLLSVGDRLTDGTVLPVPRADTPAADLRGLLVSDPAERTYLVYNNRRFLIPAGRVQQTQVFFGWTQQPLPVATAWINAVPVGPDLKPPAIPDRGEASPAIDDFEIGRLLRIGGDSGDKWAVVLGDGVADITDVQARLLQVDRDTDDRSEVDLGTYSNLPRSQTQLVAAAANAGFPPAVPVLLNGPGQVCLTHDGKDAENPEVGIRIGPTVAKGSPVGGAPAVPGGVQADLVYVPRGKGALVVAAASPTAPAGSGTVSIVTDIGRRYPVASREVLPRLGYGGVKPDPIPGQLVALLPQGPALDPVRARQSDATDE
ncbi:type VII secretion protein EccB [Amorphoplanes digitatis]|uniref:Type VII secretion protein EccB n=1 Tax=Actinoplanes digitatis TaxID=1868 RepID=A0A7W7I6L3_9ACTN|nr:type VII secretion protein EccB [Actinoplanes digitatis]MBB4767387.1 type VII secretion protein EccB [Actinoplanes digitatis]GID97288.1 type VII secretion protein EccB [Actinoplanes digitatis]